jgi:hypothetical protein
MTAAAPAAVIAAAALGDLFRRRQCVAHGNISTAVVSRRGLPCGSTAPRPLGARSRTKSFTMAARSILLS